MADAALPDGFLGLPLGLMIAARRVWPCAQRADVDDVADTAGLTGLDQVPGPVADHAFERYAVGLHNQPHTVDDCLYTCERRRQCIALGNVSNYSLDLPRGAGMASE